MQTKVFLAVYVYEQRGDRPRGEKLMESHLYLMGAQRALLPQP